MDQTLSLLIRHTVQELAREEESTTPDYCGLRAEAERFTDLAIHALFPRFAEPVKYTFRKKIKDFESVRSIPNGFPVEVWFNGTDSYSPPEQYNVIYVDGRADVYSFGQTVDALNRRYDPGLYKVIKNCTAELPWERYQSIEDVKADLISICKRKFRSIIK